MRFKFSLVIATLNREKELDTLLQSLTIQTLSSENFEVIIVDQNPVGFLDQLILKYAPLLNLKHIKSNQKGLSVNRNIGIRVSGGEYIGVPDDDCWYYADTLTKVQQSLTEYQYPDMIIGRVYDRSSGKYVFKETGEISFAVKKNNFYTTVSSITLFFKNRNVFFDENFGIGSTYHSNEDGDLILNFIECGKTIYYAPKIECNHPPYDNTTMSPIKLYNYGIGLGALCRKHISFPLLTLFIKSVCFQFLIITRSVFTFNKNEVFRRWMALKGRLKGFWAYSHEKP